MPYEHCFVVFISASFLDKIIYFICFRFIHSHDSFIYCTSNIGASQYAEIERT